MKKKKLMRIALLTVIIAILTNYGSECHAQEDGGKVRDKVNTINNDMRTNYLGRDETQLSAPGVIIITPPSNSGESGTNPGQGSAAAVANQSNKVSHEEVNKTPYGHEGDVQSSGKPTQPTYRPNPENVIGDCSKKIKSSEYQKLTEEYITRPYDLKKVYVSLCEKHKVKYDDEDYLNFKKNLTESISDRIKKIHSEYSFFEFSDIAELDTEKYDIGGAPAGWKQVTIMDYKEKVIMIKKYGFSIKVFQSTWNPQVFVMSFRVSPNYQEEKGEEFKTNKHREINRFFEKVNKNLSQYNSNGTNKIFLSYPGKRRTYEDKGEPIYNKKASGLIDMYKTINVSEKTTFIQQTLYTSNISPSLQDLGKIQQTYGCWSVLEFRQHIDHVEKELEKESR